LTTIYDIFSYLVAVNRAGPEGWFVLHPGVYRQRHENLEGADYQIKTTYYV